jgi:hypothetical protein
MPMLLHEIKTVKMRSVIQGVLTLPVTSETDKWARRWIDELMDASIDGSLRVSIIPFAC